MSTNGTGNGHDPQDKEKEKTIVKFPTLAERDRMKREERAEDGHRAQRPDGEEQTGDEKGDAGRAATQRVVGEKSEGGGLTVHAVLNRRSAGPRKGAGGYRFSRPAPDGAPVHGIRTRRTD